LTEHDQRRRGESLTEIIQVTSPSGVDKARRLFAEYHAPPRQEYSTDDIVW
jgi:hypothetical protein